MPPVPVLLAARQFTPVTPPAIATDPWDAEVLRQWATYSSDGSPFAAFEGHLRWTDSHLSKQVLDLEAQLASATAVHRFKP